MFKRNRKSKQQLIAERLDQLMCLMASDITYNEYLNVKDQLIVELKLEVTL